MAKGWSQDRPGAALGSLTHCSCCSTRVGGDSASRWFLHPSEARTGPYMHTAAMGTQSGHSRQEPVNMSSQKQVVVFP